MIHRISGQINKVSNYVGKDKQQAKAKAFCYWKTPVFCGVFFQKNKKKASDASLIVAITYRRNSWASSCRPWTRCLQIILSFSQIFIGLMVWELLVCLRVLASRQIVHEENPAHKKGENIYNNQVITNQELGTSGVTEPKPL